MGDKEKNKKTKQQNVIRRHIKLCASSSSGYGDSFNFRPFFPSEQNIIFRRENGEGKKCKTALISKTRETTSRAVRRVLQYSAEYLYALTSRKVFCFCFWFFFV